MASYENRIYAAGGSIEFAGRAPSVRGPIASMLNIQDTSEGLAESFNLGPYIHVMDFSKPFNSSQNSIDISMDNITTDIHLPVYIGDGALFISDGVMHMLSRRYDDTTNFTNTGWNFNLQTHKLDVQDLGIQDQAQGASIAFDTEKQVGWYYGGIVESDTGSIYSQD